MAAKKKQDLGTNHLDKYIAEGKGVTISLDGRDFVKDVRSTGILSIDMAFGGGVPMGRIVEIFGPQGTGKTTMTLQIISSFQNQDIPSAFIDMERTYSASYAKRFGIDKLLVVRPRWAEEAFEMLYAMLHDGYKLIVIDSVASLLPRAELVGNDEANSLGLQARIMSRELRKLVPCLAEYNASVIFINQVRASMAVMGRANTDVTPGGAALRFFSSIRTELKYIGTIKYDYVIGSEIRMRMVKNKMEASSRFTEQILHFFFTRGFCNYTDILRWGDKLKLLTRSGVWLSYLDHKLGQGFERASQFLRQDKKVFDTLRADVERLLLDSPDDA